MHSTGVSLGLVRLCALFLCTIIGLCGAGCDGRVQEVKSALIKLGNAIGSQDGETASGLYSQATLDYYDKILKHARTAKRQDIMTMSTLDRMEIVRARNRLSGGELKSIDAKGYIKLLVSKGWWNGPEAGIAADTDFGKINVTASSAWLDLELDSSKVYGLQLVLNNADKKRYLRLYKEEQVWKLDATSNHDLANEILTKFLKSSGNGKTDDVIASWEANMTGKQVPPTIWDPPKLK